jgi:thiol-disulfide isomerase/thioredoxin
MIIQITINDKKQAHQEVQKLNNAYRKGIWFIWYYADWCSHCKIMENDWSTFIKKVPKDINVAKVESNYIPKLSYKPQVQGFPTLRLYDKGVERYDYEGERNSDKFVEFLNNFKKAPNSFQNNVPKYNAPEQPLEPNQPTALNEAKLNQLFEIVSNQAKDPEPMVNTQVLMPKRTKRKTKTDDNYQYLNLGNINDQIQDLYNLSEGKKPIHKGTRKVTHHTQKVGEEPPNKRRKNKNRNRYREQIPA